MRRVDLPGNRSGCRDGNRVSIQSISEALGMQSAIPAADENVLMTERLTKCFLIARNPKYLPREPEVELMMLYSECWLCLLLLGLLCLLSLTQRKSRLFIH